MRTIIRLMLLAVLFAPLPTRAEDPGLMRLSLVEGGVQVRLHDAMDWSDASVNVPLGGGDRLWAPEGSKAELQVRGGVFVRAGAGTALDILDANGDAVRFSLDRGHVYIGSRRGGIGRIQVDTPLSSFRSDDGSVLMIDTAEDGATGVSVLQGEVMVVGRYGSTRVSAGNTLTVRSGQDAGTAPLDAPDAWERWNTERDRQLSAGGESTRYLPEELHEYSSDLDANGRWHATGEHGTVWVPTVTAATWAPYTVGRWAWIRGSYVWIAYDPWCWAPCHYGRWIFLPVHGWSWVPPASGSIFWGPGYVGWVVTPSYVAWVPLAPGEPYYGYGFYGPGSVNITTINMDTVPVHRDLVNARHRHAVTVVKRGHFGTGIREHYRVDENPFLAGKRQGAKNIAIAPPPVREHQQELPEERPAVPKAPHVVQAEHPPVAPPVARPGQARQLSPERVVRTGPTEVKKDRGQTKRREDVMIRARPPEGLAVKQRKQPKVIERQVPKQKPDRNEQKAERRRN